MNELDFYLEDLKSRFNGIDPTKYYLSYSGGKDSHFLYWFIKEYLHDNDIVIVSINTRMEHPEIMRRMYKYADIVLIPDKTIQWVIQEYGVPCFSKQKDAYIHSYQMGNRSESLLAHIYNKPDDDIKGRPSYAFALSHKQKEMLLGGKLPLISPKCCDITKKRTAHNYEKKSGRKAIIGVRGKESVSRKVQYTSCFTKTGKFTPIYDMSNELMDLAYMQYNIEVPDIYKYVGRTGCMGCPYGNFGGDVEKELNLLSPAQKKYVIDLFHDAYDVLNVKYKKRRLF